MFRRTRSLAVTVVALVIGLTGQAIQAAPVTLGVDAFEELSVLLPSSESSSAVEEEKRPVTKVAAGRVVQDGMQSGGSMHGSPSTLASPSGSAATVLTPVATAYQPALVTLYLLQEGRIDIPPRFLDGIFRPPRMG